jgi:uncharacterized membrane protein YqaE (UPF0057 family)
MALDPLGTDEKTVAVVTALINPSVLGVLRERGFSTEAAAEIVVDLLLLWLGRIAKERSAT